MDRSTKEILDIFGEYEDVVNYISEYVSLGRVSGTTDWIFYKEDYDNITPEMEELFDGADATFIEISWQLNII